MATLSSILAWRIPWTEEPGGLQSMGLQRVGRDRATNMFTFYYYLQSQVDQAPLIQLLTGYLLIHCMFMMELCVSCLFRPHTVNL